MDINIQTITDMTHFFTFNVGRRMFVLVPMVSSNSLSFLETSSPIMSISTKLDVLDSIKDAVASWCARAAAAFADKDAFLLLLVVLLRVVEESIV